MNHEKLECYTMLVSVAEEVARRVSRWPRGNAYLQDQLLRALASALLNLSEGNGKKRKGPDRRRFFEIALGSLAESSAALDLAHAFGLLGSEPQAVLKSKLRLVYAKVKALPC